MTSFRPRLVGLSIAAAACLAVVGLARSQDAAPAPAPIQSPASNAYQPAAAVASPPRQPEGTYPASPYVQPQAHYNHERRSVVHHYPYPYPGAYHGEPSAGFRNPGGRGRYAEYYAPGDMQRLEAARDPVQRAKFDQGGGAPDRNEQIAAYNAGTQRYNSIQQSIDNYSRPMMGFGFGMGGFGGFW